MKRILSIWLCFVLLGSTSLVLVDLRTGGGASTGAQSLANSDIWINPTSFDFVLAEGTRSTANLSIGNSEAGVLNWSSKNLYFRDNFEDANIDDWHVFSQVTASITENYSAGGSERSLSIDGGVGITGVGADQSIAICSPDYISFYIRTSEYLAYQSNFVLFDSAGNDLIWFCAQLDGTFYANGGLSVYYDAHTWYHIEMENINWGGGGTYDIRINGELIQSNIPMRTNIGNIKEVFLFNYHPVETWWDEIEIWSSPSENHLPSWLHLFPDNGSIDPSSQLTINLTADTGNLDTGLYQTDLYLYSNDPDEDTIIISVNLTVVEKLPHAPIRIDSNADFDAAHGVIGGNGTQANPWIIGDWEIIGTGAGCGIFIGNTTDYFTIQDCILHNTSGFAAPELFFDSGIYIHNSTIGNISNTKIKDNNIGIVIGGGSSNITIEKNVIYNNPFGIYVDNYSCYNSVLSNEVKDGANKGITLYRL